MTKKKQKYWFATKRYGWGWVPVTWQGWLVTAVAAFMVAWDTAIFVKIGEPSNEVLAGYFFRLFVYVSVVVAICFWKGEKPRWRWGD